MSTRSPRALSPHECHRSPSRSPQRSITPLADSRPKNHSRSPSFDPGFDRRNGNRERSWTRSPSRSRQVSRSRSRGARWQRGRSYSRTPSPDNSSRSSKIIVEKLTKNVTEAHLREIFGSFGDIQNLDLPMNRAFMTNRGTAYILYYDSADAEAAIAHMHEAQLDGAVLNVSIVLPRRAFSHSPPPARIGRGGLGRQGYGRVQPSDGRSSRPSPPPHRSPPARRYGSIRGADRHDLYRPRSLSLSRSPRRSRSYASQSPSRSPPLRRRRNGPRGGSSRHRRRRSPSYSSYGYSSHSDRSRSPSRDRSRNRRGAPRRR